MPHVFQALEASQGLEDFIYGTPAALPLTQVKKINYCICVRLLTTIYMCSRCIYGTPAALPLTQVLVRSLD